MFLFIPVILTLPVCATSYAVRGTKLCTSLGIGAHRRRQEHKRENTQQGGFQHATRSRVHLDDSEHTRGPVMLVCFPDPLALLHSGGGEMSSLLSPRLSSQRRAAEMVPRGSLTFGEPRAAADPSVGRGDRAMWGTLNRSIPNQILSR